MRLVDDDVAPVELLEVVLLLDDHLVRGYACVPLERRQQHVRPLLRLAGGDERNVMLCYIPYIMLFMCYITLV